MVLELKLLILLSVANIAPVLARYLLGERWGWAIDHGLTLRDGRPVFGASKTWRGLVAALLLTAVVSLLLGLPLGFGLLFAATSMLGDLLSSFTKRRLGKASSTRFLALDQIPEALLPLIAGRVWLAAPASCIGCRIVRPGLSARPGRQLIGRCTGMQA